MQAIPIPAALVTPNTDAGAAVRQAQPTARQDRAAWEKSFETVIADSFRGSMTDSVRKALGLPEDKAGVSPDLDTGGDLEDSVAAGYGCVLFAIQPPPQTDQLILEEVNDLVDQVTLCLESNQPFTEITRPLLDRLNELLGQLETPLADNQLPLAQEIMARMPQVTEQVPIDYLAQEFVQIAQAAGIEPCPLESEDDIIRIPEAKTETTEPAAKDAAAAPETAQGVQQPAKADPQTAAREESGQEDAAPEARAEAGVRTDAAAETETEAAPKAEPEARPEAGAKTETEVQKPRAKDAPDTVAQDFAPRTVDIKAEQVVATEQLQAQPPATATRETLFDTMVETIAMDVGEAAQTVSIQLKPDFLGKVTIELTMNEGQLQARIRADDHSVRDLISSQVNTLIQSLSDKGIKVEAMEVIYTGVEQEFQQSNPGQGEGFRQENRNKPLKAQKITGPAGGVQGEAGPAAVQVMDTEISSVEYRA